MDIKPAFTHHLLGIVLHVLALVLLIANHIAELGACLSLFGAFALTSLLQEAVGRRERGLSLMQIICLMIKSLLAVTALIWLRGLGPFFLVDMIILDLGLLFRPLAAGISTAGALAVLLVFAAGEPPLLILHLVIGTAIFLLAQTVRSEQELRQSMAEALYTQHSHEKKLTDLNRQLHLYQEQLAETVKLQERNRIAKGIHDTLGHTLTAIIVQLTAALQVFDRDGPAARQSLAQARDQARLGLERVRETIRMIDAADLTFPEKLRQAIHTAEQDLQVKILSVLEATCPISSENQQIILSSLQEGLTNGVRHGRASAFVFKLEQAGGRVRVYLEDNGAGCSHLVKGYGLTAMEEMIQQAGGSLEAAGIPDGGFLLRIALPAGNEDELTCGS